MSRHRYPIEACRVFERTDFAKLKAALSGSKTPKGEESSDVHAIENTSDNSKEQNGVKKNDLPASKKKGNDSKKTSKATLKTVLGEALTYGPALAEHIILDAGLLPNMKIGEENDNKIGEEMIQALLQAVGRFEECLTDIISGTKIPEGYILMQSKATERKGLASIQEATTDKVNCFFFLFQ